MVRTYKLVPVDGHGKEIQVGNEKANVIFYDDDLNKARLIKIKGEIEKAELHNLAGHLQTFFPNNKFILLQESDSRQFEYFRMEEIKDKRPGFNLGKFRINFGDDPKDISKEMNK